MEEKITIPNKKYIELSFVKETATGSGLNSRLIMKNNGDGTFSVSKIKRIGIRVGKNKARNSYYDLTYPIEQWDEFYRDKIKRGYRFFSGEETIVKKVDKKESDFMPLSDAKVKYIVDFLLDAAQQVFDKSYTISIEAISNEMMSFGKSVLDDLALHRKNLSVAEFNNKLKVLYAAIPRRMDKLSDFLAKQKADYDNLIVLNQEMYDMVSGLLENQKMQSKANKKTILEAFNLEIRAVTNEEKDAILKMMGESSDRYMDAWSVINKTTQRNFDEFCQKETLTKENGIDLLFHGSRTENFWSIITNGLTINPSGVVINGKMFGNGTYFAPKAQKSMGYASARGSYWAKGNMSSGILAVYQVATGKQYHPDSSDSSLSWKKLQELCPGAHCTWAYGGRRGFLYNDEVIVYQNQQSTIKYLIQFQ